MFPYRPVCPKNPVAWHSSMKTIASYLSASLQIPLKSYARYKSVLSGLNLQVLLHPDQKNKQTDIAHKVHLHTQGWKSSDNYLISDFFSYPRTILIRHSWRTFRFFFAKTDFHPWIHQTKMHGPQKLEPLQTTENWLYTDFASAMGARYYRPTSYAQESAQPSVAALGPPRIKIGHTSVQKTQNYQESIFL